MLYSNYNVSYFEDFIANHAALIGKPVVYLRSFGWNNSTNVESINESMSFYEQILPADVFVCLKNSEFVFMEVDDIEQAMIFLEDNFPKSQTDVGYPELYIHFSLYNALGQIILSN